MTEREEQASGIEQAATNEEEARAMVARMGGVVDTADGEMTDDELGGVSGGVLVNGTNVNVGDKVYVRGDLYLTSYAEYYSGPITGYWVIQRYIANRDAPFLLKTNVGWVRAEAINPPS